MRPLLGGFKEWKRRGYPLEEIAPAAEAKADEAAAEEHKAEETPAAEGEK